MTINQIYVMCGYRINKFLLLKSLIKDDRFYTILIEKLRDYGVEIDLDKESLSIILDKLSVDERDKSIDECLSEYMLCIQWDDYYPINCGSNTNLVIRNVCHDQSDNYCTCVIGSDVMSFDLCDTIPNSVKLSEVLSLNNLLEFYDITTFLFNDGIISEEGKIPELQFVTDDCSCCS